MSLTVFQVSQVGMYSNKYITFLPLFNLVNISIVDDLLDLIFVVYLECEVFSGITGGYDSRIGVFAAGAIGGSS